MPGDRSRRGGALLLAAGALALASAAAGCGSSAGGPSHTRSSGAPQAPSAPSGAQRATGEASSADLHASIAVATEPRLTGGIPPRYTCRGANTWPRVFWAGVPASARELVLVVRTLTRGSLTTDWAVAGISPSRREIRSGRLPAGAVVGTNSFGKVGYSLCPPAGRPAIVVFGVYAVPRKLGLRSGFAQDALASVEGAPGVAWGSASAVAATPGGAR